MSYRKNTYDVLKELNSDVQKGLSAKQVASRRLEYGKNELQKQAKKSLLSLFLEQFKDPMVVILLVGALVSVCLKELMDALIILFVIVMNALIGVVQEFKAEKALDALEQLASPKAFVVRDGYLREIAASQLVVGDIVELEAGRYIPADMRLLSSHSLKVEESTLTGESEPVEKDAQLIYHEDMPIADQHNMVFMSTFVTYGKARGIVVRTGMNSEVGKIAAMLSHAQEEQTPLQVRLAHLSKVLGVICLSVCVAMFVLAMAQGRNLFDMLMLSISLAVAAIPEGLPAVVTIVLAMGVQVMSKNNAIVRKLHAVETLGSVSVICSDKTGTLTQNKMHVVRCWCSGEYDHPDKELLSGITLCNNAIAQQGEIIGEPTEMALIEYAAAQGIDKNDWELRYVRVNEIPFDSKRKRMTTLHQSAAGCYAYSKGAVERILESCTHMKQGTQIVKLNAYERGRIQSAAAQLSADALRVLAVAYRKVSDPYQSGVEQEMTFVGLVGMIDPPREEVKTAIETCRHAGIEVVMITGDHPLTALAIARQLGIAKQEKQVIDGRTLDELSDAQLQEQLQDIRVFARVTPEHKVRIVSAFKQQGHVVAMSGDGVNDAPSLKHADIGIAMGKNGTDVCKQASDMILADDNFATIVTAVEQGRNIYANIQKAVLYLLSCNLGEIMSLFLAIMLMPNVTSTLSAIQILWVNLVTDAFPALALGVDPKDRFIMQEKPRDAKESLFAHGGMIFTVLNGMLIGTMTLVAFRYGLNTSQEMAQTMAFMVLSISQLFHALNLRSRTHSIFQVGIGKNKWLLLTILFSITLQIMVSQLPIFQMLLKTVALPLSSWLIVFTLSISVIIINELSKWFAQSEGHSSTKEQ
ncbi:MAG: calcium-translocating P-type ATPase, PMCA-type [Erysipelotrichaceae bacterium]|nr:calcium-translocating P-type ATPase, PMCA-type [Erysipelotrichaceae bacterium]